MGSLRILEWRGHSSVSGTWERLSNQVFLSHSVTQSCVCFPKGGWWRHGRNAFHFFTWQGSQHWVVEVKGTAEVRRGKKGGRKRPSESQVLFSWLKAMGPSLSLLFLKFIWQSIKWPERQALIYLQNNLADQAKILIIKKYTASNCKFKWKLNAAPGHNSCMVIILHSQNRFFYFLFVLISVWALIRYDFFARNPFPYFSCLSSTATSEFKQSWNLKCNRQILGCHAQELPERTKLKQFLFYIILYNVREQ